MPLIREFIKIRPFEVICKPRAQTVKKVNSGEFMPSTLGPLQRLQALRLVVRSSQSLFWRGLQIPGVISSQCHLR